MSPPHLGSHRSFPCCEESPSHEILFWVYESNRPSELEWFSGPARSFSPFGRTRLVLSPLFNRNVPPLLPLISELFACSIAFPPPPCRNSYFIKGAPPPHMPSSPARRPPPAKATVPPRSLPHLTSLLLLDAHRVASLHYLSTVTEGSISQFPFFFEQIKCISYLLVGKGITSPRGARLQLFFCIK